MTILRWPPCRLALAVLMLSLVAREAEAQPERHPHLAYAYPAGLRQGTSCDIVFGGQHLQKVTAIHLAGYGVTAEIVGWYRPLTQGMYNDLRMKLNETRDRLKEQGLRPSSEDVAKAAGVTLDQLREMDIFQERDRDPKRQPNEQLEEELTVRLTVSDNAEPGKRELRVLTERAMSNPLWLHIGLLPEMRESEPPHGEPDEISQALPLVVNGRIMPGDVDRFTFHAKQGTRLVIDAGAREVIPYLADAVPGWFQAVLTLQDSSGKKVAHADSFHFRQDPAILYEVPRDDQYTVTIRDSLFRGREDFVYRMSVGELPFLTSIFPLGARIDSDVEVQLDGWNLSQKTIQLKTGSRRSYRPVKSVSVPQEVGPPLRFPLQIGRLPEQFESEPNNTIDDAIAIETHQVVNGRIDQPGDQDVYRLNCHGRLVIEVQARQHGSPLDSLVMVIDENGQELAFNDDHEDKTQALSTHHADSLLKTVIPSSSPRYLIVTDAQKNGGRDFIYRLSLRSPEPDYELRVIPSTIIAPAGAVVPITVFALRKDGFEGDVQVSLVDPPEGYRLDGGLIPGQAQSMRMTLTVPATGSTKPVALEMEGQARASSNGPLLTRAAAPAEQMMQAFIWYHLVPVEDWNVIVNRNKAPKAPFELAYYPKPVVIPLGGKYHVPVRLAAGVSDPQELRVELSEPPPGVSAELVTDNMRNIAVRLSTDAKKSPAGWRGNLLLRAYRESTPAPTEDNPAPSSVRTDYGFIPAYSIELAKRAARPTP